MKLSWYSSGTLFYNTKMTYKITHYYLNWISIYYVYPTDQNVNAGTYHLEFLGRRTLLVKDEILPLGEIGFTLILIQ